jgi:hypothetical protein
MVCGAFLFPVCKIINMFVSGPIPSLNLEQLEGRLEGEDKIGFLQFIRKVLRWMPEERSSAEELIFDPWLMEGLFEPSED